MSFIWDTANGVGNSWPFGCLPVICYRGLARAMLSQEAITLCILQCFLGHQGLEFSSSCWEQEQHRQLFSPSGHFPPAVIGTWVNAHGKPSAHFWNSLPELFCPFYRRVPSTLAVSSYVGSQPCMLNSVNQALPGTSLHCIPGPHCSQLSNTIIFFCPNSSDLRSITSLLLSVFVCLF